MSTSNINGELEPVLNLIPISTAADTIRSYCVQNESCDGCKLNGAQGKGCYFNNVAPDQWNIADMIYEQTEEVSKKHRRRGRRNTKKEE